MLSNRADEFFAAVLAGEGAKVEELLAADPGLAEARDGAGVSAVLLALYHGHEPVARRIADGRELDPFEAAALGAGAVAGAGVSPDGFTALHLAAFFGRTDTVRALLAAGEDPGAVAGNPSRVQPLHSAAAGGHRDAAALLLEAGADPNAQQAGGWTALHSRMKHDDQPFVELLLAHGADRTVRADDGTRPGEL